MRIVTALLLLAAFGAQGCYAYVRTYDSNGNLLGECDSGGIGWGWAVCTGSANPRDQGHADPLGPKNKTAGARPESSSGDCPQGQVSQYGSCYPMNPIIGGSKK